MTRLPNGLRKVGGGWKGPFSRARPKPVSVVPTPEEVAQRIADNERFTQRMLSELGANRGLDKIKDREARIAVEGDTDLNHDNIEAAE